MVVISNISERTFYIIIAVIAVVGLIFILIQLRKIRKTQKKVKYLGEELKLKKVELVKGDMKYVNQKNEKVNKSNYSPNFGHSTTKSYSKMLMNPKDLWNS